MLVMQLCICVETQFRAVKKWKDDVYFSVVEDTVVAFQLLLKGV